MTSTKEPRPEARPPEAESSTPSAAPITSREGLRQQAAQSGSYAAGVVMLSPDPRTANQDGGQPSEAGAGAASELSERDGPGAVATTRESPVAPAEINTVIQQALGPLVPGIRTGAIQGGLFRVVDQQTFLAAFHRTYGPDEPLGGTQGFIERNYAGSGANIAWISQSRQDPDTAIHEGIHMFSNTAFLRAMGELPNEGVTEHFSRQVCVANNVPISYGYQIECFGVQRLIDWSSEQAVAAAYFDGQVDGLRQTVGARRLEQWRAQTAGDTATPWMDDALDAIPPEEIPAGEEGDWE